MPRVLIITYYWPPSGGAGVQRWLKFTKYLPEFGWEPVIYTPSNPEAPVSDPSLEKDIPAGITVLKRPINEPYSVYKRFVGMGKEEKINSGFLSEKKKPGLAERVSVWIRGNLFIPDARRFWIRPSVRFLKAYLLENKFDAVITTGPPHSMHLIGLGLKKQSDIFWIADFRDPWTGIDFYHKLRLSKRADQTHHRLEREVLQNADQVIAVGHQMAEELKSLGARNCLTIPNGYDPEDFGGEKSEPEKRFSILHLGAINKDRNHEIFYRVLSGLIKESQDFRKELHLKFIGKNDHVVLESIEKWGLGENTEFISYIPHSEIQKILSRSRILYLPINNTPNSKSILTGKIFEYLAAGRPVLGIGPEDGDAARIIRETGSGHMVGFDNDLALREIITGWFDQYRQGILKSEQHGVEKYSRRSLTSELAAIMKR